MGLFKKSSVPDELPDLAVDQISKANSSQAPESGFHKPSIPTPPAQPDPQNAQQEVQQLSQHVQQDKDHIQHLKSRIKEEEKTLKQAHKTNELPTNLEDEQGFFKDLVKGITDDPEALKSSPTDKILKKDIVDQMKTYWEKQSPQAILNGMDPALKAKLLQKIDHMHALEKEWQEAYFKVLTKEEQIRNHEKELKDSLSDFVSVFKNSVSRTKSK